MHSSASDAAQALELATELAPDVTLLGLATPGPAMTDLVRALTATGTRVVLLGEAGSGGSLVEALRAGARGYVYTTVSSDRLVEGARRGLEVGVGHEGLHAGGFPYGPVRRAGSGGRRRRCGL